MLPMLSERVAEMATEAFNASGEPRTDRYCGLLAIEADTYETTGPETGEGYARILLHDDDRIALALLSACDRSIRVYGWGDNREEVSETIAVDFAEWSNAHTVIVFWDDRGFHYPTFAATEAEAEELWSKALAHCAEGWSEDEDEEEED